jgi:rubrerythrin
MPFHLQNGELFKSIFDLYRGKVWKMTKLKEGELTVWNRAWLYYQYRRTRCGQCGNQGSLENPVLPEKPCPYCGHMNPAFR